MRKILITGGAGFVGRRFVKRFLDAGDLVYVVDPLVPMTGGIDPVKRYMGDESMYRVSPGWPLYNPYDYRGSFRFYRKDCRSFFKQHLDSDFDYVLHLAAIVGGRLMISYNPIAVAEDLAIDSSYWQWAVQAKPKKTICFSSSAAYPTCYQEPGSYRLLYEDLIQFSGTIGVPDMTYGWAKLTNELLANLAYQRHGLESVVYRPFSGYGEDQDDTYPFPSICRRVLTNTDKSVVRVWGSGEQMRDFIHIEDCVDGVLTTMDKIDNAGALNLSTGIYTSMKDFARTAADLCGYSPNIVGMDDKPSGSFARAGSTVKQKQFGFSHKIGLRDGVHKALKWFEGQPSLRFTNA